MAENCQKFLRFQWKGKNYQYTCLPNGITSAPRIFTKLMKPVYSTFPRNVIICVGINTDFFSCIKNPKFCNKQTVSFTLLVHSNGVSAINNESSRKS
jgi:hypothetical protein